MTSPKISVIVPTYNSAGFLNTALDSLLGQTEKSLEILVVDDGSTDSTPEIISTYAARDSRVRSFSQPHQGVSVARNLALESATGEWIAFLDADDYLDPNTFQLWLEIAETKDLQMVVGNGFTFKSKPDDSSRKNKLLHHQPDQKILTGKEWIQHCVAVEEWPHYIWLQLAKRQVIEEQPLRFEPGIGHQDILWTMEVALSSQRIGFCSQALCGYRKNPDSVSRNPNEEFSTFRAKSYLVVLKKLIHTAAKLDDPQLSRALLTQTNREAGHFMGLIRKRIQTPDTRKKLASDFLNSGIPAAMLRGATNFHEWWRAIRCWGVMQKAKRV